MPNPTPPTNSTRNPEQGSHRDRRVGDDFGGALMIGKIVGRNNLFTLFTLVDRTGRVRQYACDEEGPHGHTYTKHERVAQQYAEKIWNQLASATADYDVEQCNQCRDSIVNALWNALVGDDFSQTGLEAAFEIPRTLVDGNRKKQEDLRARADRLRPTANEILEGARGYRRLGDRVFEIVHDGLAALSTIGPELSEPRVLAAEKKIAHARSLLEGARNARKISIGVTILFFVLLLTSIGLMMRLQGDGSEDALRLKQYDFLGIPSLVWAWSFVGSITAVAVRAWRGQRDEQFQSSSIGEAVSEVGFRVVIGFIMGAVVYLALVAGLILLLAGGDGQPREEALLIAAFVGAFSDATYARVIGLLSGSITGRDTSAASG